MARTNFLIIQEKLALDSLDREIDNDLLKTAQSEVSKLNKKKEELERMMQAFNQSSVSRLDGKTQKQFDYFTQELKKARDKMDKDIEQARDNFEKYEKHLNSNITRITGNQEVIDPERITRIKIELDSINSKIGNKQLFLDALAEIELSKNPCVRILPEKTWIVDPIKEAAAIFELQKQEATSEGMLSED